MASSWARVLVESMDSKYSRESCQGQDLHEALEAGMTLAQWNAKLREADGYGGGCEHG